MKGFSFPGDSPVKNNSDKLKELKKVDPKLRDKAYYDKVRELKTGIVTKDDELTGTTRLTKA